MTEANKYFGVRYATEDEINTYKKVEKILVNLDDEIAENFIEIIGDYNHAWIASERKKAYNKIYRIAKKLNTTVKELCTWYNID